MCLTTFLIALSSANLVVVPWDMMFESSYELEGFQPEIRDRLLENPRHDSSQLQHV